MVAPFVFPGHAVYLEAAARERGRPEFARAAGRQPAVAALASLCAQASRAEAAHVDPILLKAGEFRDQLAIALEAADAILAAVRVARSKPGPQAAAAPAATVIDHAEATAERRGGSRRPSKGDAS